MIAHSLPGRLRLRHPALRDQSVLDKTAARLRKMKGAQEVTGSAATGALLVRFAPPFDEAAAAALVEGLPAPAARTPGKKRKPLPRKWHKAVKAGMGGMLGGSLLLAAANRERAHMYLGFGFLAFLACHLGLNRSRITL